MNFDIRTLSIITAMSSLVFAFSSLVVARLVPRERHLRDWALGSGLAALSTLLVGLRGVIPDLVSAALANTLLAVAMTCMYIGTRGMVRLARPWRGVWLFSVFAGLGLCWFTVIEPSVVARLLIVSAVLSPLLGMTGFEFLRYDWKVGPSALRPANRITGLIYFVGCCLFLARVVAAIENADATTYLQTASALLVAPYFWAILFNVWLAIMVTLTVSARLQAELAKARDLAEANSLAKSRFLANISHEIRTPMNAILGMLSLLQGTELSSQQRDYTSKTEGAARSLLGLLNDVLDFSKADAGKMVLDPQPFNLERLLRDLSVVLSANVGAKNIAVLFDVDPHIPPQLVGDALRLQQVLVNLGGNAVKFTAQGQVVLSIRLQNLQGSMAVLEFTVQDSGIGIAPENQGHIFSGFSQAEASTTRRYGGSGLGLAISQRLVEAMGGTLKLTSVLGQGSTFGFVLSFPVAPDSAEGAVQAVPRVATPPRSVLVVDSNAMAAENLSRMTRSWTWPTQVAHSGEQALDLVRAQGKPGSFPFEVVVLDWHLPGLDGWATLSQIRRFGDRFGGARPIVIMVASYDRTALSQRTPQEQGMLDGFLAKPITPSMLQEAILQSGRSPVGMAKAAPHDKPKRLLGMRLLVVEDNPINQQVARELLRKEGAEVTLATNGQLGVDAVAAANPSFDAVLMDIQMPVLDGYGATRLIREQLGLTELPIIAMTANAMASDREACLAAGMNAHIGKPFDLTQLVSLLTAHCRSAPADRT